MYLPSTTESLASLRCSATKSLSRAPVQSASSYAHGGRNDRPPRAASSWLEMHEAVSGQRSRRPSLTPTARAARGVAASTNAAARLARRGMAWRRGCASDGLVALAIAGAATRRGRALARAPVLGATAAAPCSAAHRWSQAASCNAIQRCACLRIMFTLLRKLAYRASIFAAHLAGCSPDRLAQARGEIQGCSTARRGP